MRLNRREPPYSIPHSRSAGRGRATPLVEPKNEEAAHEQLADVLIVAELFVVHGAGSASSAAGIPAACW